MDKKEEVNFRKFKLSTGKEIVLGKDSIQNDLLVDIAKRNDLLLHTVMPGSPFVNLGENPTKEEIYEGAIFCALKSQDFRDNQKNVMVHSFLKSNCFKEGKMKSGTWGVKKTKETIKVKKEDILKMKKTIEISK